MEEKVDRIYFFILGKYFAHLDVIPQDTLK